MTVLEVSERALVLQLRTARRKARSAAVAEVVALVEDLGGRALSGGPLSEVAGTAWVAVKSSSIDELSSRISALGYSSSVRLAVPEEEAESRDESWSRVRWRGRSHVLQPVYNEPTADMQAEAPDRRSFLLECGDGVVRRIEGYRGGRGPLEHRALPVADARLLVNLVGRARGAMLDPFAGAGSVMIYGRRAGWSTVSLDVDPTLRFGLAELAGVHVVGDATRLPFASSSFDAIATEPPYHESALEFIAPFIAESARVLRPGARMSLLVGAHQANAVRLAGRGAGLTMDLDVDIDRKGTSVTCLRMLFAAS